MYYALGTHFEVGLSAEVLYEVRCNSSLMAICLVVEVQHVTLWEQLGGIGAVVSNGVDMGERFHAELTVESATERIEDLVLLLRTVPHIPLMHVSNCGI